MTGQAASVATRVRWRRMLLVLLAVSAILSGLLAMHGLTTSSVDRAHASLTANDQAANTVMHGSGNVIPAAMNSRSPSSAQNCDGGCGPNQEMLGMACVLALLFTVLLFALHPALSRREKIRRNVSALAAKVSALAPPTPPSLHCLSISRT